MEMEQGRGNWSGTLGFVLAAMGSAVGLGNVWRFSYITGEYGGAAFILVYLGCVVAVGIPIMIAELLIGRSTQRNVVGAFTTLRPRSPWLMAGWLGVTTGFVLPIILSSAAGSCIILPSPLLTVFPGSPRRRPNTSLQHFRQAQRSKYSGMRSLWLSLFGLSHAASHAALNGAIKS